MRFFQVNERCNGCLACVANCPARALDVRDEGGTRTLLHNMARCARCATCFRVCPQQAVEFQHLLKNEWAEVVVLDLVRCRVCNQPVHAARLGETLEARLGELAEPLCDKHRAVQTGRARTRFLTQKSGPRAAQTGKGGVR